VARIPAGEGIIKWQLCEKAKQGGAVEYFTFPQVSNWTSNGPTGLPVDVHWTFPPFVRTGLGKSSSSGPVGVRYHPIWCPVDRKYLLDWTGHRTWNWKKSSGPTGLKSIRLHWTPVTGCVSNYILH